MALETEKEFTEWVNTYTHDMLSWAAHKVSDVETAEDLVQDSFLAAYHSLEKFENKSSPKTWLMSILNNKIVDHYRQNARSISSNGKFTEETATDLSESFFNKQGTWQSSDSFSTIWGDETHLLDNSAFNEVLQLCLDDLPENWRTAITSKYLIQKSADDICQELGITSSNYWQIIHRAKLMLKKCIEAGWTF
jgi:RNA polymerase sigma-70 factor (ECF subfamily)